MPQLLLISSTLALALLVAHSWRTRGRRTTLAFFLWGVVFGVIRGNAIWLLMKFLGQGSDAVLKPYLPADSVIPPLGHESMQVAVGWVFTLYLSWTVAELILRRLPKLSGRIFMTAGLASLVVLAITWCMETTAVAVGWWYWTLPTRTGLFGTVNVPAMEGWFSIVPDFLIPFLVIACARTQARGRWRRWLWLLAFPLHLLGHLCYRWFEYAHVVYNLMELLVVGLMMFVPLRMAEGEIRPPAGDRLSGRLFGAAAAIFLAVIVVANAAVPGQAAKGLTVLPMLLLCLLAWDRVPLRLVLLLSVLSLAAWAGLGPRALWALAPLAVFWFMRWTVSAGEPLYLKAAPSAVVILLSVLGIFSYNAGRTRSSAYLGAWAEGDRLAAAGRIQEAEAAYKRSEALRPENSVWFYQAIQEMSGKSEAAPGQAIATFERRLPHMVREMEEIVRREPDWVPLRQDLVRFYCLQGRIADAAGQYREMHRIWPKDGDIAAMVGYFLLREGKTAEAEAACREALALRHPPPAALVNLGVILYSQGRDDEAKACWERAIRLDPQQVMAQVNLDRLQENPPDHTIDLRYLAPVPSGPKVAAWTSTLATNGRGYTPENRIRLILEATQLDPTYTQAHLKLAALYVDSDVTPDGPRGLWHARRAVALARAAKDPTEISKSLLVLGFVLIKTGRTNEARAVLAEGKASAPPEMIKNYQEIEKLLPAPG